MSENRTSFPDKYRKYKHVESNSIGGHSPSNELEKKAVRRAILIYFYTFRGLIAYLAFVIPVLVLVLIAELNVLLLIFTILVFCVPVGFSVNMCIKFAKYNTQIEMAKCVSSNTLVTKGGRYRAKSFYVTAVIEEKKIVCDVITDKKSSEWMEEGETIYLVRLTDYLTFGVLEDFISKK